MQVAGRTARLYVNQGAEPALIVTDLVPVCGGSGIALWIGNRTIARFANVRVTPW